MTATLDDAPSSAPLPEPDVADPAPRLLVSRFLAWISRHPQGTCTFVVVAGSVLFIMRTLRPTLVLANNTPSGGDMGAHVWGPAFLRDYLLPHGQVSGWSPDWYGGFPAYRFYMVLPSLAIVALNLVLPYGVAFKLVAVLGVVSLPVSAWAFGKLAGTRFPVPAMLAVGTLPFLYDTSFSIYGGNISSMLAGEFAYGIAFSLMLVYLGLLIRALRHRKGFASTGVVLALVCLCHLLAFFTALIATAAMLIVHFRRGTHGRYPFRVVASFVVAALIAAFWAVPTYWFRKYTFDMGWVKLHDYFHQLFPGRVAWVIALAAIALFTGLGRRDRFVSALALAMTFEAVAFRVAPQGRLWNARLLPFWYLGLYLLAALGFWEVGQRVLRRVRESRRNVLVPASGWLAAVVFVGLPMGTLWFTGHASDGHPTWFGLSSHLSGLASVPWEKSPGWIEWNFAGYEGKATWPEYKHVVDEMGALGQQHGCGRALWEYDPTLDQYGTPMALMLLPYWTKGCIGSMEGLYFESSPTTPFHFLMASEAAKNPSRPVAGITQWRDLDLDYAVEHMQLLGVKYYMAQSPEAIAQGRHQQYLTEIASVGRWVIFEVAHSELVVGLDHTPYVEKGIDHSLKSWTETGLATWDPVGGSVLFAAPNGPADWPTIKTGDDIPHHATPRTTVTNLKVETSKISFDVDHTGGPVLVKTSYFPDWKVSGAYGPYRVTPNLMVVVPTSKHVVLHYEQSTIEDFSKVLTLVGVALAIALARVERRRRLRPQL